jgi:hypothetical protein
MPATQEILRPIGFGYQRVRLSCVGSCTIDDNITAYVRGIPIGSARVSGRLKPGEHVDIPIDYLPWVELPAEIRFADSSARLPIPGGLKISSPEEALLLVGPGDIAISNVSVEQGMLRGSGSNLINGLSRPTMYARINGLVVRPIVTDPPRLLDDGGCSFQFAMQLLPTDLVDSGITIDIHVLGVDAPVSSVTFSRMLVTEQEKRLIELEGRLQETQQTAALQVASLKTDFDARLARIERRIETFIEYASSFMLDRVAAVTVPTTPGAKAVDDVAIKAKMDAFRSLVSTASTPEDSSVSTQAGDNYSNLPLHSSMFAFGWYDIERTEEAEFRWMSPRAIVFNPEPNRLVSEVILLVAGLYRTSAPSLKASFDARAARAKVEADGQGRFRIHLRPPKGERSVPLQALRLESLTSGNPHRDEGSADDREISMAIAGLAFVYSDRTPPATRQ